LRRFPQQKGQNAMLNKCPHAPRFFFGSKSFINADEITGLLVKIARTATTRQLSPKAG